MIPSGVSCKGELYMDDRKEGRKESVSPRNYGTSRWKANEDQEDRDNFEQLDEEKASAIL